jgi:DNA-directed RNA polymerase subunit F
MEVKEIYYLTYSEIEDVLKNFEKTKVIEEIDKYVKEFKKLNLEEERELREKLKSLNISKLKLTEELIIQIINILPKNKEELRAVLKFSRLPFNEEEIEKIMEILKEYTG